MKFSLKLAILVSAMALLSNTAMAEIVSSAQISQTGWRLVDLDANDGITPGISFFNANSSYHTVIGDYRTGEIFSDYQTAVNADPVSSALAHLNSGASSRFENGVLSTTGKINDSAWITSSQARDEWFVLTPHTRLEYFGVASGSANNDGRDMPPGDAYQRMFTIVTASVTPNGRQSDTGADGDPFNHYYGSVGVRKAAGNFALNDNFLLNYVNNGNTDLIGKVELTTYVFGSTYVPAVPEPETYAMMLGGIAVLGALARRRKM